MAPPVLYSIEISPPVRAVRLTAAAIGLELDIRPVDLFGGEHLKEPFLKINPQHTVPVLNDDGRVIWDSHAINTYIIEKYAANDELFSKNLIQRAKINQRLFFDSGVLHPALKAANRAIYTGAPTISQEAIDSIFEALDMLESFLKESEYVAGNSLTVADFCCVATVTSMELHVTIAAEKYSNILGWIERLKNLTYFNELNTQVMVEYQEVMAQRKQANRVALLNKKE